MGGYGKHHKSKTARMGSLDTTSVFRTQVSHRPRYIDNLHRHETLNAWRWSASNIVGADTESKVKDMRLVESNEQAKTGSGVGRFPDEHRQEGISSSSILDGVMDLGSSDGELQDVRMQIEPPVLCVCPT